MGRDDELETIRAVAQVMAEKVAVMNALLNKLDAALYGNGKPGDIETLKTADMALAKAQAALSRRVDKILYIGLGMVVAMEFMSGSGVITLKSLLQLVSK